MKELSFKSYYGYFDCDASFTPFMVELGGPQAITSKVQSLEKSMEVLKQLIINIKDSFKSKRDISELGKVCSKCPQGLS